MSRRERGICIIRMGDLKLKKVRSIVRNRVTKVLCDQPEETLGGRGGRVVTASDLVLSNTTTLAQRLEFLSRDLDALAVDFLRRRIKCAACNVFVSFMLRGDNLVLASWFTHTMKCGALQEAYRKELDLQIRVKPDPDLDSPSLFGDPPLRALFRLQSGGIRQIRYIRNQADGQLSVISESFDGSGEEHLMTPYRFSSGGKSNRDRTERVRLIKGDPDAGKIDWAKNMLWCGGCGKRFLFKQRILPNIWVSHKVRCKSLQEKFTKELECLGTVRENSRADADNDTSVDLRRAAIRPVAEKRRTRGSAAGVNSGLYQAKRRRIDDEQISSPEARTGTNWFGLTSFVVSAFGDVLSLVL